MAVHSFATLGATVPSGARAAGDFPAEMGTRVLDVTFVESAPVVPDVATSMSGSSVIVDLGQGVDPEGNTVLPLITSLPSSGKLYQVDEDGVTKVCCHAKVNVELILFN